MLSSLFVGARLLLVVLRSAVQDHVAALTRVAIAHNPRDLGPAAAPLAKRAALMVLLPPICGFSRLVQHRVASLPLILGRTPALRVLLHLARVLVELEELHLSVRPILQSAFPLRVSLRPQHVVALIILVSRFLHLEVLHV